MSDNAKSSKKASKKAATEQVEMNQINDQVRAGYDEKNRTIYMEVEVPEEEDWEYTTSTEGKDIGKRNIRIHTGSYTNLKGTPFKINPSVILKETKAFLAKNKREPLY